MAWKQAHATANQQEVEKTLHDMQKRNVDIDDLLQFRTTEMDLKSTFQSLCDPESNRD
jgi:hypothetical protein